VYITFFSDLCVFGGIECFFPLPMEKGDHSSLSDSDGVTSVSII
jgi:hypothetical protein